MGPLAAILLAAAPQPVAGGVMTVTARVAPACGVRAAPSGVVVVCAGRTPYVVRRPGGDQPPRPQPPGRANARPAGVTITF